MESTFIDLMKTAGLGTAMAACLFILCYKLLQKLIDKFEENCKFYRDALTEEKATNKEMVINMGANLAQINVTLQNQSDTIKDGNRNIIEEIRRQTDTLSKNR